MNRASLMVLFLTWTVASNSFLTMAVPVATSLAEADEEDRSLPQDSPLRVERYVSADDQGEVGLIPAFFYVMNVLMADLAEKAKTSINEYLKPENSTSRGQPLEDRLTEMELSRHARQVAQNQNQGLLSQNPYTVGGLGLAQATNLGLNSLLSSGIRLSNFLTDFGTGLGQWTLGSLVGGGGNLDGQRVTTGNNAG